MILFVCAQEELQYYYYNIKCSNRFRSVASRTGEENKYKFPPFWFVEVNRDGLATKVGERGRATTDKRWGLHSGQFIIIIIIIKACRDSKPMTMMMICWPSVLQTASAAFCL